VFFTGQYFHSIDKKGRVAVPARYRHLWDPAVHGRTWCSLPRAGSIRLYPKRTYDELAAGMMARTLTPDPASLAREAILYSFTHEIEPDSAGRITLPKEHLEISGLGGEVVILGAGSHLRLMDRGVWKAGQADHLALLDELLPDLDMDAARQGLPE